MLKLFMQVKKIQFARQDRVVVGMADPKGESFSFRTAVAVEGPVETWMTSVNDEMVVSLHSISKQGVFVYARSERLQWIHETLGMVTILGSSVWWTWEVEDVFRKCATEGDKYAMKNLAVRAWASLPNSPSNAP